MNTTWYRASWTVFGSEPKPGSLSLFVDYNLCDFSLGFSLRLDLYLLYWVSLRIDLWPITLDLVYWRRHRTLSTAKGGEK